jgi:hypothetical protein
MSRDDPWSGAGEATRSEVREIFARHGAARSDEPEQRRTPLPGFLTLPARGWRALSRTGKVAVLAVALALAALAVAMIPPALETATRNEANERRARAANLERIRRELVRDQRPRRARLDAGMPVTAALAVAVAADAAARVRRGTLEGPLGATTCEPVQRSDGDPEAPVFTCLVEQGKRGVYRDRALVIGYRFRGRVVLDTRRAAWCKENPRPLHPDQEEFVVVPLSRACTG